MRHEEANMGNFTSRQERRDIHWPEIPADLNNGPPKREGWSRKMMGK